MRLSKRSRLEKGQRDPLHFVAYGRVGAGLHVKEIRIQEADRGGSDLAGQHGHGRGQG